MSVGDKYEGTYRRRIGCRKRLGGLRPAQLPRPGTLCMTSRVGMLTHVNSSPVHTSHLDGAVRGCCIWPFMKHLSRSRDFPFSLLSPLHPHSPSPLLLDISTTHPYQHDYLWFCFIRRPDFGLLFRIHASWQPVRVPIPRSRKAARCPSGSSWLRPTTYHGGLSPSLPPFVLFFHPSLPNPIRVSAADLRHSSSSNSALTPSSSGYSTAVSSNTGSQNTAASRHQRRGPPSHLLAYLAQPPMAGSTPYGRFMGQPRLADPYSRIGFYTVCAQQTIDRFETAFEPR